jgi:F0F1-type ATP synthase membrane subunit b/b'
MEINLTFCVQIINFILFYQVISYFFLKPFVAIIQAKIASRERILTEFASKEAQLKKLVHARTDLAQEFKHMLKDRYALPAASVISMPDEIPLEKFSDEQQDAMTNELVKNLAARIKNAY